eukprot:scaffold482_cov247-Pinguiococcus_pyrenoidosus.AAC.16
MMRTNAIALLALVATAQANLMLFFDEDINGVSEENEIIPLNATPKSDAARDKFFSFLIDSDIATRNLDDLTSTVFPFPSGTPPPITLTYPDGKGDFFNATIEGAYVLNETRNGQYSISEHNYLRSPSNTWTIEFDCPVVGFGFYGIDVGDVDGQLNVTLEFEMPDGDGDLTVKVNHTMDQSGNVFYLAFLDEMNPVTKVTFRNVGRKADDFVYDDFTVAKPDNVDVCHPDFGVRSEVDGGVVCCCISCEACGGCDCGTFVGGASKCCPASIFEEGMECTTADQCGCYIVPAPLPLGTLSIGDGVCQDD